MPSKYYLILNHPINLNYYTVLFKYCLLSNIHSMLSNRDACVIQVAQNHAKMHYLVDIIQFLDDAVPEYINSTKPLTNKIIKTMLYFPIYNNKKWSLLMQPRTMKFARKILWSVLKNISNYFQI